MPWEKMCCADAGGVRIACKIQGLLPLLSAVRPLEIQIGWSSSFAKRRQLLEAGTM